MEKTRLSFEAFQELWIEQETQGLDNPKDKLSLERQLDDALYFDELFETIQIWSNIDLKERVTTFLERNNAEIDYPF